MNGRQKWEQNKNNKYRTVINMVMFTIFALMFNAIVSIITLNVNHLNVPIEYKDCNSGSKDKTHLYVIYKKVMLYVKTHID